MCAAQDEAAVKASERSVRRIMRGQYVGFDADDLRQEGRLAALEARAAGRVPADPEHALRYLLRRTQGAMLDYGRATRRQLPPNAVEWQPELDQRAQAAAPDARLIARDMIRRLRGRGSPRIYEVVELLARGHEPREVAAALGVTETAVSQWRKRARLIAGDCL